MQGYVSRMDEVAGTFAWAAPELLMGGRCSEKARAGLPADTPAACASPWLTLACMLMLLPVTACTGWIGTESGACAGVCAQVDIYSFGVVLWELATCERPQRGRMRELRCAGLCAHCPSCR